MVETADRPADGLPPTSAPAAASRARTSSSAAAGRDRRWWRPRALAAEDPDGAPSQVDDLVTLLGGAATVPLLKVLRRLSVDKWVTTGELLAPLRALTSAESAVDGTLRVLKLLEAHGMGICLDRVGASPLLDQPLRPAIEAAARRWVTHELKKPSGGASGCAAPRWRHLRAARRRRRRGGGGGAGAAAAGEREWASFCSAYDRIKGLDDLPGYPAWLQEVKGLLWRWWSEVCFVFTVGAAGSTDGGAAASLSCRNSPLCKCVDFSRRTLRVVDSSSRSTASTATSPTATRRALVLHEFMEALLRIAAIRHEQEPAARGLSLPAALEQLRTATYSTTAARSARRRTSGSRWKAQVRRHIVRHDAELRRTFGRAAAATPGQLSIDEWLSLMGATELKLRDGAVRAFRKGELIDAFQAAQLFGDDNSETPAAANSIRVLVYPEFVEALGRLALNGAPEAAAPAGGGDGGEAPRR